MEKKLSAAQQAKYEIVEELKEKIQNAHSFVVLDYKGLTVAQDTEFRASFRNENVEYKVLKNTLFKKALNELGYTEFDDALNGPSAFAFGHADAIAPAKILTDFAKKNKNLTVKCGVCDGAYMDEAGVTALASTPSREVLIARIMGSMMSSVSKFVYCLEAIRKKQAGEE